MSGQCGLWHGILAGMTHKPAAVSGADPSLHALLGTVLLAIGGMLFVNVNEDPEIFIMFTVLFAAPGLYLLIAGAVAHGVAMSRE